jgi:hypothetical protein
MIKLRYITADHSLGLDSSGVGWMDKRLTMWGTKLTTSIGAGMAIRRLGQAPARDEVVIAKTIGSVP